MESLRRGLGLVCRGRWFAKDPRLQRSLVCRAGEGFKLPTDVEKEIEEGSFKWEELSLPRGSM